MRRAESYWSKQTQCSQGHAFDVSYVRDGRPRRACQQCRNQRQREYKARKRAA